MSLRQPDYRLSRLAHGAHPRYPVSPHPHLPRPRGPRRPGQHAPARRHLSYYHRHLQAGDARNRTPAGQLLLGCRWQVEPAVAWLTRYQGCRVARCLGQAAAQFQVSQACAMRNLLMWVARVQRKAAPRPT